MTHQFTSAWCGGSSKTRPTLLESPGGRGTFGRAALALLLDGREDAGELAGRPGEAAGDGGTRPEQRAEYVADGLQSRRERFRNVPRHFLAFRDRLLDLQLVWGFRILLEILHHPVDSGAQRLDAVAAPREERRAGP